MANDQKPVMGIENEFQLISPSGLVEPGSFRFDRLLANLKGDYFKKSRSCVRLNTGGSFYIDGDEPEITTAPFYLERGAVTAMANNLFSGINKLVDASDKSGFSLRGYSAHYSFTFPHLAQRNDSLVETLVRTVNPVVQLFIENRESSGVMFRDRPSGRLEICGDYAPTIDDVVVATAFQASFLKTMNDWYKEGYKDEIMGFLRYQVEGVLTHTSTRSGLIIRTPQVIEEGRDAELKVRDLRTGNIIELTAQDLLDHYSNFLDDSVLSTAEKDLLYSSISGQRRMPIDDEGLSSAYEVVERVETKDSHSPLSEAFGNSVLERKIGKMTVKPKTLNWSYVSFTCGDYSIDVDLEGLTQFESLLKDSELFEAFVSGETTEDQNKRLEAYGIKEDGTSYIRVERENPFFSVAGDVSDSLGVNSRDLTISIDGDLNPFSSDEISENFHNFPNELREQPSNDDNRNNDNLFLTNEISSIRRNRIRNNYLENYNHFSNLSNTLENFPETNSIQNNSSHIERNIINYFHDASGSMIRNQIPRESSQNYILNNYGDIDVAALQRRLAESLTRVRNSNIPNADDFEFYRLMDNNILSNDY